MTGKQLEVFARLVGAVVETVREVNEPVPESTIYLAFQSKGLSHNVFTVVVDAAVRTGQIKRGPMPHTLVAS